MKIQITTVRLNVLIGIALLGLIVVGGDAVGVDTAVLTAVISGGIAILKDIVQSDSAP